MIAFARAWIRQPEQKKIPLIKLSEPDETIIIRCDRDRIDAEIGADNRIKKLIIYVKTRPRRKRWIDHIWR